MGAADAGIIAIVQGIVRYVMESNVRPDIVALHLASGLNLSNPNLWSHSTNPALARVGP